MMMLHSAVIGTISNGCSTCGEGERRGEHLHARHDLERLLHPPGHPLPDDRRNHNAISMQSACNQPTWTPTSSMPTKMYTINETQRAIEIGDIAPASTKGKVAIHSTRLRTCMQ